MLLVAEPSLGVDEKTVLAQVIDSGWITMGGQVRNFERAFAEHHHAGDAVAVSSCTAGLHLVMRALGIGPGDEVLVPALTFVATANSVLYVGATPVFVDIESPDVPHVSPADAAARCSARTKAVVVMHYAGYLVDLAPWRAFAQSRGLFLIEDAAHAVGVNGVGTETDAAVFSFFGNKNMTTAEGGMIVARDDAVLDDVRRMRSHGMTSSSWQRAQGQTLGYDVTTLGYNYRMDELRAAVGLTQLKRLAAWNEKRGRLTHLYRDLLQARCPQVQMPFAQPRASAYHVLPVLLPRGTDRHPVMQAMHAANVQTTVHYPPVHLFSYYRETFPATELPITEDFSARELTLPLHPGLEPEQVETVVDALSECLGAS
jgi:dTDP-4-amino-4,6-dideoxygalactose transaminase